MIFNVGCDLHAQKLGTQICNFNSAMFACNVCVLELVSLCSWPDKVHCDEGPCIAIILMSGSYTLTLKLLHCAVKQFLRHNISLRVSGRPDFRLLVISLTRQISYVFLYLWSGKKVLLWPKSRYIRALCKRLFFPLNNTRKRDRELCLVKTGTSLYPSSL